MTDRLLRVHYVASYAHYVAGQWQGQLNYIFRLDSEDDQRALRLALGYAEKVSAANSKTKKELKLRELIRARPVPFPADTRLSDRDREGLEQQIARVEFSEWR